MTANARTFRFRPSIYALAMVLILFSVLPLSQRLFDLPASETVTVRRIELAPPPPPPPEERENAESGTSSRSGINLNTLESAVQLSAIGTEMGLDVAGSGGFGLGAVDFGVKTNLPFSMQGVSFGVGDLDRQPFLIVRPTIENDYLRRRGIDQFEALVMVKMLKDGSLILIRIEEIEYPESEFVLIVRDLVPRMRYSRPTVDGEPVEKVVRLPLIIHAN